MSTHDTPTAPITNRLLDDVLPVLADDDRQEIVIYLVETDDNVLIEDLVAHLATQTHASAEQLRVRLQHVHLPKLAAHDIIAYDASTVQPTENAVAAVELIDIVDDWTERFHHHDV